MNSHYMFGKGSTFLLCLRSVEGNSAAKND